jgi:effector-binding domain-containing protein
MAVWRLQVNTGGANVADCLQNHVAALWAGKVLAYLMGNYDDSKDTYEKLFDWIDEHKFKTGKYSYKEAVIDELATASPSEYLTKISIQVF